MGGINHHSCGCISIDGAFFIRYCGKHNQRSGTHGKIKPRGE